MTSFASDVDARVDAALDAGELTNLHGVVVARSDEVVFERYVAGADWSWGVPLGRVEFTHATLHDLRSVTKSIVSLLYGIAVQRGMAPPPDAPLLASFPEYPDLASDPRRRELTIEHALTMTMGTEWDESRPYTDPANSEIAMESAPDRYRYVLERPIVVEPGTTWKYNGGATALLGALVSRGSGMSLPEFANAALFAPLGITRFEWLRGEDGTPSPASGLRLAPRDLAGIGRLVLQDGEWDGQTVVPSSWLAAAMQARVQIDDTRRYGYQWYLGTLPGPTGDRWVAAFGNGGQQLWVLPRLDLVVACTFGNYDQPDQVSAPAVLLRSILSAVVN